MVRKAAFSLSLTAVLGAVCGWRACMHPPFPFILAKQRWGGWQKKKHHKQMHKEQPAIVAQLQFSISLPHSEEERGRHRAHLYKRRTHRNKIGYRTHGCQLFYHNVPHHIHIDIDIPPPCHLPNSAGREKKPPPLQIATQVHVSSSF